MLKIMHGKNKVLFFLITKRKKNVLFSNFNRQGLFDRYLSRMETRKNEIHNNKTAESDVC